MQEVFSGKLLTRLGLILRVHHMVEDAFGAH